ncbi:alpha/beta hydrolase-fold protein [Streptomyces sp. NPDC051366]|uniref:alpha/beta hydrolase-fold protein n=1 Tax=Streptomyces sp. NPDC051366 TaxID=3365652 RepID=UPI0037BCE9A6
MNDAGSGADALRYEDMFIEEFVPSVEQAHGLGGRAERRAVAGLSMGGYGALMYALRYPGRFGAAAGLSTAHFTDEGYRAMPMGEWNRFFGHAFARDLAGSARLTDRAREYNLADIVRRTAPDRLRRTRYHLGCGTEDTNYLPGTEDLRSGSPDLHSTGWSHSRSTADGSPASTACATPTSCTGPRRCSDSTEEATSHGNHDR